MASYPAKRDPNRQPIHPGEMIQDILHDVGKSKIEIAALLGISRQHLHTITEGKKPVSPAIAVRLGRLFGGGTAVWLRMQATHDAWIAERDLAAEIKHIRPLKIAAA